MNEVWLEIEIGGVTSRVDLRSGLTRLGGPGSDVVLPGAPEGELHLWSDPAKVVHVSGRTPLERNGTRHVELLLTVGEPLVWGALTLVYRQAAPVIEEIPMAGPAPVVRSAAGGGASPSGATLSGALSSGGDRAWARVRAGMAIELGAADKKVVSRWQDAVLRSEFDADACSREVLERLELPADDPRLVERAGRLLRDFLMSSLQRGVRGASRKVRSQAKSGTAYLVANLIAIGIYTAIVAVVMVLARLKWNTSFDSLIDLVLGRGGA